MPSIDCKYLEAIEWKSNFHQFVPLGNSTHVFKVNIPNCLSNLKEYRLLLENLELKKAERYHQEKDRQRYIISRAVLKLLIGQYLAIPANEVSIGVGVNKKPLITNKEAGRLQYNLTHAGDWILIAFSNAMIGVDLEYLDQSFQYEHLLPTCFSQLEQKSILEAADSRRQFYLYWTRKEALVKATGKGIDESLLVVPCIDGMSVIPFFMEGTDHWIMVSFPIGDAYIASLAYPKTQKNTLFMEQEVI